MGGNPSVRLSLKLTQGGVVAIVPGSAQRALQVDVIVFDKNKNTLKAYEIKRGVGHHDSGKKRQMLRDTLCVQVLLKSYGKERGYDVTSALSHTIFYYGKCSIPKPLRVTGAELDEYFGWPVHDAVEEVKKYFQERLFSILAGAK